MTNYIFFLRVTPFLPNTFINVASPVVNVPYFAFLLGTIGGTFPNNFMAVKVRTSGANPKDPVHCIHLIIA